MGLNEYCTLGFEPLNFNTGNFVLTAQDAYQPDLSAASLDFNRTYNGPSGQMKGPLGAFFN